MQFIYVKIPLNAGMVERMPGLHEALELALSTDAAGGLIGWGSSSSAAPGHGVGATTHHRLDIDVFDQARALAVLKETLPRLSVPDGTEVHYTQGGRALQMVYARAGWGSPTPSTAANRPALRGKRSDGLSD